MKNKKVFILILTILILILIINAFFKIVNIYKNNTLFAQTAEKLQEEIENPIFKIEEILIYSDANIEDLSENQNLEKINISQYTDFAIIISNSETVTELTEENTVNNISIDNITVTATDFGTQKVAGKSLENICKYRSIETGTNNIEYTVLHTNEEKDKNTDTNTFYTDCSEPLVFSYVNENIIKDEDLSSSNEIVSLDGSILNNLNINLEDLNFKISFTINIENNLGENFECDCSLDINLDSEAGGIYTGYIMYIYDLSENNYTFRKVQ